MAKLEAGNKAFFRLDGIPKTRGAFEPVKIGDEIGLRRDDGTFLAIGTYSEWTDSSDSAFASENLLLSFIESNVMTDETLL